MLVALTLVPLAAALIGGFAGSFGTFAMDGIRGVTPVAVLLAFAVIYFGVMNDAGPVRAGDPGAGRVVVGTDPVRIALGTAAVASVAHLDGAGASTFMVTVPAMLPLYTPRRHEPAGAHLHHRARGRHHEHAALGRAHHARRDRAAGRARRELFVPVIPAMIAGMAGVFVFAIRIGRHERHRHRTWARPGSLRKRVADSAEAAASVHGTRVRARFGRLWYFNALLTALTLDRAVH